MKILRILGNGLIILGEIGAAAAVAWLGYTAPFAFAALSAVLALLLGLMLEAKRLRNELPFYFGAGRSPTAWLVPVVGLLEAAMKGLLAGVAAIFTFAGTDSGRLFWVAVLFGLTVYAGSSLLRVLSIKFDALPARWGFFRLASPLGLLYSAGIAMLGASAIITASSVPDIGWKIIWDMPANPSIAQVSELVFQLKQAFDDFVVRVLSVPIGETAARLAGIAVSVNVLAGFVAALYASLIAGAVRGAEQRLP